MIRGDEFWKCFDGIALFWTCSNQKKGKIKNNEKNLQNILTALLFASAKVRCPKSLGLLFVSHTFNLRFEFVLFWTIRDAVSARKEFHPETVPKRRAMRNETMQKDNE